MWRRSSHQQDDTSMGFYSTICPCGCCIAYDTLDVDRGIWNTSLEQRCVCHLLASFVHGWLSKYAITITRRFAREHHRMAERRCLRIGKTIEWPRLSGVALMQIDQLTIMRPIYLSVMVCYAAVPASWLPPPSWLSRLMFFPQRLSLHIVPWSVSSYLW